MKISLKKITDRLKRLGKKKAQNKKVPIIVTGDITIVPLEGKQPMTNISPLIKSTRKQDRKKISEFTFGFERPIVINLPKRKVPIIPTSRKVGFKPIPYNEKKTFPNRKGPIEEND